MAKFYAQDNKRQIKYDLAQLEKNIPKKAKKAEESNVALAAKEESHE